MKHSKLFLTILAFLPLLTSCHTALQVPKVESVATKTYGKPNMEFIGFKNMNRNTAIMKNFGAELERRNIALNRQDFYMGVYSLQELETYKSTMRYVTFIDISRLYDNWNDAVADNDGLEVGGWVIAGITCFTLFPVYVPMLCAADGNSCQLDVSCVCTLYVYDTQKDEIILSIPIEYKDSQTFKGQYSHKKTDREAVKQRSRTLLYNSLLPYFERAYNFIQSQKK